MQGSGFFDFLKKAGSWLSRNKILSGIGSVLTPIAPEIAGPITAGLKAVGLGRRRYHRIHGGALKLAGYHRGGSLMPAGAGYHHGGAISLAGMGRRGKKIHLLM